ncbi:MAG: hypothetical protein WA803_08085 [Steroidobacteraceae bacterium]
MNPSEEAQLAAILARLAESREELRRVLEPQNRETQDANSSARDAEFPRSRTMQMLMSGRGLGILGAIAAGLFVARPALMLKLLRMLPAGATARILLLRAFAALRAKPERPRRSSPPST